MFPHCDRHHQSQHNTLCMHPPLLLFIHSFCYSKASQLSPDHGLTKRQQLHRPHLPATFCNGSQERTGDRCTGVDIGRKTAAIGEDLSVSWFQREFSFLLLYGHAFCWPQGCRERTDPPEKFWWSWETPFVPHFPKRLVILVSICNWKQVKKWGPHWSCQQVFHPENAGELCSWRSHCLWPWWAFTLLSDPCRTFPFQSGSSGTPAWGNAKEQGQGESWLPWSLPIATSLNMLKNLDLDNSVHILEAWPCTWPLNPLKILLKASFPLYHPAPLSALRWQSSCGDSWRACPTCAPLLMCYPTGGGAGWRCSPWPLSAHSCTDQCWTICN